MKELKSNIKKLWKTIRIWWNLNVYTYTNNYIKKEQQRYTNRIGWTSPDGGCWVIAKQSTFRFFNKKYILTVEENQTGAMR